MGDEGLRGTIRAVASGEILAKIGGVVGVIGIGLQVIQGWASVSGDILWIAATLLLLAQLAVSVLARDPGEPVPPMMWILGIGWCYLGLVFVFWLLVDTHVIDGAGTGTRILLFIPLIVLGALAFRLKERNGERGSSGTTLAYDARMGKAVEERLRPLADDELQILEVLLTEQFPGNEALATQLVGAQARRVDTEGSLELAVTSGTPAAVVRRIPVEAEVEDTDGTAIHVLLHVVDGLLNELEFFREDGGVVQGPISSDRLRPFVL